MRLFTAKTSSDSFPPQTQAGRVNVKVNSVTDHNTNITVLIGRAELTVSRLFSKISRASSLLHSSSMHSRSRFPFLLSSNIVLARLCRCRNWEALFCERTGRRAHENFDCLVIHHGFEWPMQMRVHNIYSKILKTTFSWSLYKTVSRLELKLLSDRHVLHYQPIFLIDQAGLHISVFHYTTCKYHGTLLLESWFMSMYTIY